MSPTYTFRCETCKTESDEFHSMVNCPDFITCDGCGNSAKREISTGSAFHLKGTNWARDKYTAPSNLRWMGLDKGKKEE